MNGNTNNMSLVCLVCSRDYNCRTKHKHSPRASRVASAPSQFHATPHGRSRLLLPLCTHMRVCVRVFSAPSLRAPERQVILFNMLSSLMLLPPSDGDCTPLLVAFVRTRGAGPHQWFSAGLHTKTRRELTGWEQDRKVGFYSQHHCGCVCEWVRVWVEQRPFSSWRGTGLCFGRSVWAEKAG